MQLCWQLGAASSLFGFMMDQFANGTSSIYFCFEEVASGAGRLCRVPSIALASLGLAHLTMSKSVPTSRTSIPRMPAPAHTAIR